MYYYNQKKIHYDEYEDNEPVFDQVYDEPQKFDSKSINQSITMDKVNQSKSGIYSKH
jgi:hypothetical protein